MGKIIIKLGDITDENVDVIVNAANTGLRGGGGVDGAIHRAAGSVVLEECKRIGGCKTGEAVMTSAGKLKAKKIIHTPGPVWKGGSSGEPGLLRNSYKSSFKLAKNAGLRTIAFPSISTGVYGYPIEGAAKIALGEGLVHKDRFDEIKYVCFSERDLEVYCRIYTEMTKGAGLVEG